MVVNHWLCRLLGHRFRYVKPWFFCERCGLHIHNTRISTAPTRKKFPFWSEIITQVRGSASVTANSTAYVNIQPPSGEVWLVDLLFSLTYEASGAGDYSCRVTYNDYDGVTAREHGRHTNQGKSTYKPVVEPKPISVQRVLTNTLYARIGGYNQYIADTLEYGYSGFKLSQPLWSSQPAQKPEFKPWKKSKTKLLPSAIRALDKYAFDILGVDPLKPDEYDLGIILEEDTVLAIDPATQFPVERLTVVVQASVLADFIAKFKGGAADPIETGYTKYLKKWRDEGIDLGVPM